MMYWFTLPLIVISLGGIAMILVRHWKEIRLLDPDSIKEERARQARDQIIQQRFQRLKSTRLAPFRTLLHQVLLAGKKSFHAAYLNLIRLNRLYKQTAAPFAHIAPSRADRIQTLLEDARSLMRDVKWADAERRLLEVLAMDDHSSDAYRLLGLLYLKQKLYSQARETFEFLIRSKKADDTTYAGLAEIEEAEGRQERAEELYRKAIDIHPKLAHRHMGLAEFYLRSDHSDKAWPELKKALELEPKSQKYLEVFVETALDLGKRDEARRGYDRLRLLNVDQQKLRLLKERLDRS